MSGFELHDVALRTTRYAKLLGGLSIGVGCLMLILAAGAAQTSALAGGLMLAFALLVYIVPGILYFKFNTRFRSPNGSPLGLIVLGWIFAILFGLAALVDLLFLPDSAPRLIFEVVLMILAVGLLVNATKASKLRRLSPEVMPAFPVIPATADRQV